MARRTKDEMLVELRRLSAMLDAWRDYQAARWSPAGPATPPPASSSIDKALTVLRPGGPRLSDLLGGFQQAVNDMSEQIGHTLEQGWPEGRGFLAFYRDRAGREWWSDAGNPAQMGRAILRRGRIRDETEWYLLANLLAPVDQTVFSAEEVERLDAMRRAFEDQASR